MKSKKIIIIVTTLVIVIISTFFIIQKIKSIGTVKIGLITDLSGKNSELGISARHGLEFAINEINNSGGLNNHLVELIEIDHRGSKDLCVSGAKSLVDEGVDVVISPILSGMASSVINGVGDKDVLVIGPTVSSDQLSRMDDNFIRVASPGSLQGVYISDVIEKIGDKKIAVIIDDKNSAYTHGVAKAFRESVSDNVILEEISFGDNLDVEVTVSKLIVMDIDAILFIANAIDSSSIIQAYAKESTLPHLYGVSWTKASGINIYGGNRVEGMIVVDSFIAAEPSERELDFNLKFKEYFNLEATTVAIYFYEAMKLYALGATESKSFDTDSVKYAILNIDKFDGITESYHLDKYGDGVRALSLFIIKNNEFELYNN